MNLQVKGFKKDRTGANVPCPGKLFYCGYDVEDIVDAIQRDKRFGFEETVYLLLTGELPASSDLEDFVAELGRRRRLPEAAKSIIKVYSENDDQMSALHAAVSVLHKFDPDPKSMDLRVITRQCIDIIAKFPAIIAYNYSVMANGGHSGFVEPREDMGTAQNFLYMLNGGEAPDEEMARVLDMALILHAEHGGGNNSTFTVRTVSSSMTDTYMAICAGIASLAGHLEGGANEAVMRMMDDIKEKLRDWSDEDELRAYLRGILRKESGDGSGKIYGMGSTLSATPASPYSGRRPRHSPRG